MKTSVRLPTVSASISSINQEYGIYMEKYFLDCIWRDSERPDEKLTANSGTSKSSKIFVTFYAGDIAQNRRLVRQSDRTATGIDCDVILHRSSEHIGELASFYEYTDRAVYDSNYWFENQFTNQHRQYNDPGFFIGYLNTQALMALQREPYVTVRMENNRDDQYRSPFWYSKFLVGVSFFNETTGKYEIRENNTTVNTYFQRVQSLNLAMVSGPYTPRSLYTLAQPLHPDLYDGDLTDVFNVTAKPENCLNLMTEAEVILQQVSFATTESNASVLENYVIPTATRAANGEFVEHPIYARSDFDAYTVSKAEGGGWEAMAPSTSGAGKTPLLPYPTGEWRGEPLVSQNTALSGVKSAFPWERQLSADQLQILDGAMDYNASMHASQVLPSEYYLYMPSGDWSERVGERSLQVDFGRPKPVNKLQLLFPKSQERWQPTRLNATIQRAWPSESANTYADQYPAFWHQGFQHRYPYGKNDGGVTKYIHTLTQRSQFNGETGDMLLGTHTGNLVSTYNITGNNTTVPVSAYNLPVIVEAPSYANAMTMEVATTNVQTFETAPNAVNPATNFQRFEYGPYLQGATLSWLKFLAELDAVFGDITPQIREAFPVAVCPKYRLPDPRLEIEGGEYNFSNFQEWLAVGGAAERALGGRLQRYLDTSYDFYFSMPFWGAPGFEYGPPTPLFEISASQGAASNAFDFSDETHWEAGGYSGNEYVVGTNNYIGSTATPVTLSTGAGGTVHGEWVQLKTPVPILPDGCIIEPFRSGEPSSTPNIASSINGNIFDYNYGTSTPSGTGDDPDASLIAGDGAVNRYTFTTSSLYDKNVEGDYVGTAVLPNQRDFVYLPTQTPDYDVNGGSWTPVAGEWFSLVYDTPVRIKGFELTTKDVRRAPGQVAIFCKNATDTYWFKRNIYTINGDWSRGVEELDDDVNGDPGGFTHWAVVFSKVHVNYVIEAPADTFVVYDTYLGREIRAKVEERAFGSLISVANAVQNALNEAVDGQVNYAVKWNDSSSPSTFKIWSNATVNDLEGEVITGYDFSILSTPLAEMLGFSDAFGAPASDTFVGSNSPSIIPTETTGVTGSITLHEAGEDESGNLREQDQPVRMVLLGSNDGTNWSFLGQTNPNHTWRGRGSSLLLGLSFENLPGGRQRKRTQKYQYFRFVVPATQKSTNVRIRNLRLYALDYDNPEYAAVTLATYSYDWGGTGNHVLDVDDQRRIFELDYSSPNERDEKYANCYDWLLKKFYVYQTYKGNPVYDYLVKEEYYFAPSFDQEDEESVYPPFDSYRPNYKATSQKMVVPRFAEGRYAGIAVGYESTNRGSLKGNANIWDASADRDHKCFSWRLCHQLYDFSSKGGKVAGGEVPATFNKYFQQGMLTGVNLVTGGDRYRENAALSATLGDTERTISNQYVREMTSNIIMTGVGNVVSSNATIISGDFAVTMSQSNTIVSRTMASEKSPLFRKADFTLNFITNR